MIKKMALVLLMLIAATALWANGDQEGSGDDEQITLTLYTWFPAGARQVMSSLADHSMVQEIERISGYNLEFIHPPEGSGDAFFNTTIASGQYPDLWNDQFKTYPGGPEGAMEDGILANMNDLIEEYAPNFMARIEAGGDAIRRRVYSDSGTIIRFGTMFQAELTDGIVNRGLVIRQDIMDDLGLEIPETTDEFLEVLRAIQADGSVMTPLALSSFPDNISWGRTFNGVNAISSAFGVASRGYFVSEGRVVYSPIEPGYRDFLAYVNTLYSEGLLYQDFPNVTRNDTKKMFNAGQAAVIGLGNWEIKSALALG